MKKVVLLPQRGQGVQALRCFGQQAQHIRLGDLPQDFLQQLGLQSEVVTAGDAVQALAKQTSLGVVGFNHRAGDRIEIQLPQRRQSLGTTDGLVATATHRTDDQRHHGLAYFQRHGMNVKLVPQQAKHRYIYLLDSSWRSRVRGPVLPYPKSN